LVRMDNARVALSTHVYTILKSIRIQMIYKRK
jgi:hypothetical protein